MRTKLLNRIYISKLADFGSVDLAEAKTSCTDGDCNRITTYTDETLQVTSGHENKGADSLTFWLARHVGD